MRAQIISENLEFTRGKDSKQALGVGLLRDIVKPDNLTLPVKYSYGSITDAKGNIILKANRDSQQTPLQAYERDDLLKITVKLLNWAFGSVEQVQESYEFKRGQGSKKSLDIGIFKDLPRNINVTFPIKYSELQNNIIIVDSRDYMILKSVDFSHMTSHGKDTQKNLFKSIEILLNSYYPNGELTESYEFKRGGDSKSALDVGDIFFNDKKYLNIPEELLDDWRDTNYPGRGIITTWHKKNGIFTVYKVPDSVSPEDDIAGYELDEFTIDELILELGAYDQELNYKYNPDTYQWDKL